MKEASRIGFATTQVCFPVSHVLWYWDCGDLGMEIHIYVYTYICIYTYIFVNMSKHLLSLLS